MMSPIAAATIVGILLAVALVLILRARAERTKLHDDTFKKAYLRYRKELDAVEEALDELSD